MRLRLGSTVSRAPPATGWLVRWRRVVHAAVELPAKFSTQLPAFAARPNGLQHCERSTFGVTMGRRQSHRIPACELARPRFMDVLNAIKRNLCRDRINRANLAVNALQSVNFRLLVGRPYVFADWVQLQGSRQYESLWVLGNLTGVFLH